MTLDWEHSVNKAGAVKADQEYKLRCTSRHSYPPARHRYFKNGVELSNEKITYKYKNDSSKFFSFVDILQLLNRKNKSYRTMLYFEFITKVVQQNYLSLAYKLFKV